MADAAAGSMASPISCASDAEDGWVDVPDVDPTNIASVLKRQLLFHFSSRSAAACFATSAACPDAVNPGLSISDVGPIGLPLSSRDRSAIVAAIRSGRFGSHPGALAQQSVHASYVEVGSDRFTIRNPAWPTFLHNVVRKVAQELGISSGAGAVEARPYKVMMYGGYGVDKERFSFEGEEDVVGALVFILPSRHAGGAFRTRLGHSLKTFEVDDGAEFQTSYIAWYSDVAHEVRPLTSGTRLSLVYKLIYTASGTAERAATLNNEMGRLRPLLSRWRRHFVREDRTTPDMLVMMLRHKYTDSSLSLDALTGRDKHRVRSLAAACDKEGFIYYLANVEKMVYGLCNDDDEYGEFSKIIDRHEEHLQLTQVADLHGSIIGHRIDLDQDVIMQNDPFGDPDEETFVGEGTIVGPLVTHYYRNSAVLIIARTHHEELLFELALQGRVDLQPWIERLMKDYETSLNPDTAEELKTVCRRVVKYYPCFKEKPKMNIYGNPVPIPASHRRKKKRACDAPGLPEETLGAVITACLRLKEQDLYRRSALLVRGALPTSVYEELGKGVNLAPFDHELQRVVLHTVFQMPNLYERRLAILAILRGFKLAPVFAMYQISLAGFEKWIVTSMMEALETAGGSRREDAEAAAWIISGHNEGPLYKSVRSFVDRHLNNNKFAIPFAAAMAKAGEVYSIPEGVATGILQDILPPMTYAFTLLPPKTRRGHSTQSENSGRRDEIEDMTSILSRCITLGLDTELEQLFSRIEDDAEQIVGLSLNAAVVPFLKSFLDKQQMDPLPYRACALVKHLIATYIRKYVTMEPERPADWVRPAVDCKCNDCKMLNDFLLDPENYEESFTLEVEALEHIYWRLTDRPKLWSCKAPDWSGGYKFTMNEGHELDTLVVEKLEDEYERLHSAWWSRCHHASARIKTLGEDRLRRMYASAGEYAYDEMIGMADVDPGRRRL